MEETYRMNLDEFRMVINCLERQMKKDRFKPNIIIGIGKGGLIPAVFLANHFKAQLKVFIVKHYHNREKTESVALIQRPMFNLLSAKDNYLIVDDIAVGRNYQSSLGLSTRAYTPLQKHQSCHSAFQTEVNLQARLLLFTNGQVDCLPMGEKLKP